MLEGVISLLEGVISLPNEVIYLLEGVISLLDEVIYLFGQVLNLKKEAFSLLEEVLKRLDIILCKRKLTLPISKKANQTVSLFLLIYNLMFSPSLKFRPRVE